MASAEKQTVAKRRPRKGRCATCRHWFRARDESGWAGFPEEIEMHPCEISQGDYKADTPAFFADNCDGLFGILVTSGDFGCVRYEAL